MDLVTAQAKRRSARSLEAKWKRNSHMKQVELVTTVNCDNSDSVIRFTVQGKS
jgi:hypothetical protein